MPVEMVSIGVMVKITAFCVLVEFVRVPVMVPDPLLAIPDTVAV